MAKRSRIKNLMTATSAEIPTVALRSPATGQPSDAVIALSSPAAGQSSKQPTARRAGKRARADPSAELVAELTTEQPTETANPIPAWRPHLKHRGQDIPANASIKADKEHLLAFDLSKALLLPSDVVGSDHVPDTRLVKSSVKSMARVSQSSSRIFTSVCPVPSLINFDVCRPFKNNTWFWSVFTGCGRRRLTVPAKCKASRPSSAEQSPRWR